MIYLVGILTVLTVIRALVETDRNDPIFLNSHLGEGLSVVKMG